VRKPKGWCSREGFSFVSNTDQEFQQDRAFVAGKPLQPNLILEGYANSLPNRESAKMCSIRVRFDLILKYHIWVQKTHNDKNCSFFVNSIHDEQKCFITLAPGDYDELVKCPGQGNS